MSDPNAAPAAQEADGQAWLDNLNSDDRAKWELTGEVPSTTESPAELPDSPEPPDEDEQEAPPAEAAKTTAPAPAPTPEKPISKRQQQINDLIRKATEADLRAQALEARIAELGKAKPAAEPEKKPEPAAVVDPSDPEPQEAQFEDYRAYVKAQARWEYRQAKREEAAEAAKANAEAAEAAQLDDLRTKAQTWVERRDAFAAKTPAFVEKALPFLDRVHPGTPIGDVLLDSPVGPQLALHLAEHPDVLERIQRAHPIAALRELGKLEAKFDDSVTSASASAGPAARTVTTAPAPPMTLAARSADPADPVKAAIERGDFSAFEAEENRRAVAHR